MELTNEFTVGVPVERAWQVLTDVEGIAPCMPGAELQEVAGDEYRGIVKVKVGPITAQYKGAARFVELDERGRRAVLRAEGRDTRGQGNANATITATLVPDGDGTRLRQWMRLGPGRTLLNDAIERMPEKEERIIDRRLAEHRINMEATVRGIKELAETSGG